MDFIRYLMGLDKVDYIGYSYGTWLGAWYSKIFGSKYGGRFLLDSAVDVTQPSLGHAWLYAQGIARERRSRMQLDLYDARTDPAAAKAAKDPGVTSAMRAAGADSFGPQSQGEVAKGLHKTKKRAAKARQRSGAWKPSPAAVRLDLTRQELPTATGDYAQTLRAQSKALQKLEKLDPDTSPAAEATTITDDDYFNQVRCNDGQWRQGKEWYEKAYGALDPAVQDRTEMHGDCSAWRTKTIMPAITDPEPYPDTLVIQSELDAQTSWTSVGSVA